MAQDNNQFQPQYNNPQQNNPQFDQYGQNTQSPNLNNGFMDPSNQFGAFQGNIPPVINNGYTPYHNNLINNQVNQPTSIPTSTPSNIQDFSPNANFDTGIGNTFNTKNFNPDTNPNFMPSVSSGVDYEEDQNIYTDNQTQFTQNELEEKPENKIKKYLVYGLIGFSVFLLVAGISFFVWTKTQTPAIETFNGVSSIQPVSQTGAESKVDATDTISKTNTPVPIKTSIVTDAIKTGVPTTPASKSLLYPSATTLPADWLIKNFDKKYLNEDGSCKLLSVCSEKSDPDLDGLANIDEYRYGTNPNKADSDMDGISDKDELFVYFSNPRNDDTDGDTYKDGAELTNCYDMNIAKQSFSKARLNEITSNISKPWNNKGLSEVTISTLKRAGATADDLEKGYLGKCLVGSTNSSAILPVVSKLAQPTTVAQTAPTETLVENTTGTDSTNLVTPTLDTNVASTTSDSADSTL